MKVKLVGRQVRWAILTMLGVSSLVLAFKPEEESFGHTKITRDILRKGYSFAGGPSVDKFSTSLAGDGTSIEFSDQAADEIIKGNQSTDWIFNHDQDFESVTVNVQGEINREEAHCDNDKIPDCSARIISKKQLAIAGAAAYVASKDKRSLVDARIQLGKALHTIQDFYAHSNWSDNHAGATIYGKLTQGNTKDDVPLKSVPTCVARSWSIFKPGGWFNNGGNYEFTTNGKDAAKVTSGYFDNFLSVANVGSAPDGAEAKCDHGVELLSNQVSGINKDAPYSPLNPAPQSTSLWDAMVNMLTPFETNSGASAQHVHASYLAALHTRQFLQEVVDDIRRAYPDPNAADEVVAALLGVDQKPLVGFVIDTTGSMGDIIAGVRQQVQNMIDAATSTPGSENRKFLVQDYGDPYVGTPVVGTAAQVKTRVAGLFANGGGDCPELTQAGLLAALSTAPAKSVLYVFTDASSKDASRVAEVREAAKAKGITVTYVVSGSCSPIDPTYYDVAAATGGLVLVTEHSAASVAAAFTGITIETEGQQLQPIKLEQGPLSAEKTIAIPVESNAARLTVQVTSSDATIDFLDPAGQPVVAGPSVVVTEFLGGKSLRVTNPAAGSWRAVLRTATPTTYALRADGASALNLVSTQFTKSSAEGRAGHEASTPYNGAPPRTLVRLNALLSGQPRTALFELVGENGTVLATFDAARQTEDAFAGTVTLPATPFRIKVSGTDANGAPFARMVPTIYTANTLLIEVLDAPVWTRGGRNTARIRVTNYADARDVTLDALPTGVTLASITPRSATLASGASAIFEAAFDVPSAVAADATLALNLAASAGTDSAKLSVPFTVGADTDGDGVPDTEEKGRYGADEAYDGNGDGTPDWKQASVASLHTRSGNSYVTVVLESGGTLSTVAAISVPDSLKPQLPVDGFRLVASAGSGTAKVRFVLPEYLATRGLFVAGSNGTWVDGAGSLAALTAADNVITASVADGQAADADGVSNGAVTLVAAPLQVRMAGVSESTQDVPPQTDPHQPPRQLFGGRGGCTMGDPGHADASLLLLVLASMGLLYRRARRDRSSRPTHRPPEA